METLVDFINSGDVVAFVVLIAILCFIGNLMIQRTPELGRWGWRLAAGALILYSVYMGSELDEHTPDAWLPIVWRGLLAAGVTLGISWILLAIYGFVKSGADRVADRARARAEARRRERERKQREKEERQRAKEWERDAPERERQRQIAEERRLQQEAVSREARQTREDTRYACELFYNLHAPKIGERFSKQELHDFLNRYMGDAQSLDVIRQRTNQLVETIRQHVEAVDPPEEIPTLEGLAAWYEKQKAHLEESKIEASIKEDFCIRLRERYSTLTERLLEEVKP